VHVQIWRIALMSHSIEALYRREHVESPAIISSPEDVDALIDSLLTGAVDENLAQLFSLQRSTLPSGDPNHELLVGVDRELQVGVLAFMDDGNEVSLGPLSSSRGEVVYCIMRHATEFPDRSEVPLELVRRAVKEFLVSGGQRPTCVEWQMPEKLFATGDST
jgi:hypothetical protein